MLLNISRKLHIDTKYSCPPAGRGEPTCIGFQAHFKVLIVIDEAPLIPDFFKAASI